MKPNTPKLAITTGLISRSPGQIRRYHCPINIAVQRCGDLLGFTQYAFSPTRLHRPPERTFVFALARKISSKRHSSLIP